jgi:hypothetical protein
MAIYRDGDSFYVNGLASAAPNPPDALLRGHQYSQQSFNRLCQIYGVLLTIQGALLPVVIWFGPVQKIWYQPVHMNWLSLLAIITSIPVLIAIAVTLLLSTKLTIFNAGETLVEKAPSRRYYAFYSLFCINFLMLFISAPWGPGWHIPGDVAAPASLIVLLMIGSLYRLSGR